MKEKKEKLFNWKEMKKDYPNEIVTFDAPRWAYKETLPPKEKLFNWKVKLQLIFVVLMLLLLNAIAPKPFAKHEQVECINIEERQWEKN